MPATESNCANSTWDWPAELDRMVEMITGPLDPWDTSVNGDPDSLTGEENESGFDEMADWPETDFETEPDEDEC